MIIDNKREKKIRNECYNKEKIMLYKSLSGIRCDNTNNQR